MGSTEDPSRLRIDTNHGSAVIIEAKADGVMIKVQTPFGGGIQVATKLSDAEIALVEEFLMARRLVIDGGK